MAATLVVPNYWRPGAEDWRRWRLAPWQRINRLWGMICMSRKETLVRTLDAYFGPAKCPFTPRTYVYAEIITSQTWPSLVSSRPYWLLKTAAHRGQGLKLVGASELLAASRGAAGGASESVARAADSSDDHAGGTGESVASLRACSVEDARSAEEAVKALGNLAANENHAHKIVEAGGAHALVRNISAEGATKSMVAACCEALAAMIDHDKPRTLIVQGGAVGALANVILNGSAAHKEAVGSVLVSLCVDLDLSEAAVREGVLESLPVHGDSTQACVTVVEILGPNLVCNTCARCASALTQALETTQSAPDPAKRPRFVCF